MSVNNKKILLLYNYLYENSFINYYKWLIDFYIFDDCWCNYEKYRVNEC